MRRVSVTQLVDFAKCEKLAILKLTKKEVVSEVRRKSIDAGIAEHRRLEMQTVVDGRCFVASYAFGVSAKETNQLRAHRDQVWATSAAGRLCIQIYYKTSPWAVKFFQRVPYGVKLARFTIRVYIKVICKRASC